MSDVRPAWIFDDSPLPDPHGFGERAVAFIRKLKHPKSRKNFSLDRWQERIVRRVYGDTDENGRRKIRTVYLRVGRGNRKTSLVAALSLLHMLGPERTPGGLGIVAASDREQARLTWQEAVGLISMSPTLSKATNKWEAPSYRLNHPKSGSEFVAISSDGDSKHGKTPSFVVCDEVHAWQGRRLWAALTTGLVKVPGTLLLVTTTAGAGTESLAFQIEKYARSVASGAIDDPSYLPVILETPDEFDWQDEKGWAWANPGLPHYPDIVGLRSLARQARHVPAAKAEFQQFHLNQWQSAALSPWLDMAVYDESGEPFDIDDLEGEQCWVGVDYGAVHDLTAVVAVFPRDDEFYVAAWCMLPEDGLLRKSEQDGAPYPLWIEEGHVIATEGNVVDRRVLADKLRELCETFSVQEISYDPYRMQDVAAELSDEGLPMAEFRQGWISMSPAVESVQASILAGKFRHGGNPVLRWCFNNVVTRTDPAGNQSFHKGKSRGRIDAAVAATMALHRASRGETVLSIYATDERAGGLLFV
ncbi:terminase large subunit [Mesorhizobium sp. IMUNJ 23232]|uniref:terminase large subunit n=1 Tax=Mesorhizobium sp. IMUNJ 23232 TaxID=3376064 RepID=UPI0037A017A3